MTEKHILMVHEYLDYWSTIRTCCGPQASIVRREELHGLVGKRPSYAPDRAHCELYDLDAVEDALLGTPLWRAHWKLRGTDFSNDQKMERGKCCHSEAQTRSGFDFHGAWRPDTGTNIATIHARG